MSKGNKKGFHKGAQQGFRDMRRPAAPVTQAGVNAKITFPCDYSLKVVGDAAEDFAASVCQVVIRHAPDLDATKLEVVDSRNGRFQSVRITIRATGEQQLNQLFLDLKATGRVHMVV